MPAGMTWDTIPEALLIDAAQLTKANSIDGNKRDGITVIYTPSSNLKKDGSMDVGQVSFHKTKQVKKVFIKTRENVIVNRLNKTKEVKTPNLEDEQRAHLVEKNKSAKEYFLKQKKEDERIARELKAKKEERDRGYSDFLTEDMIAGSSNDRDDGYDPEEDFM